MNILVRAPNWIGDQILAYPFFHYLRAAYPKARITVACVPWVETIQFRNLIDRVQVLPLAYTKRIGDKFRAIEKGAAQARAEGPYDLAISLPNSFSAAWFAYRSGARSRYGYAADGRGWLLNRSVDWETVGAHVHRAEAYVRLLPEEARPPADRDTKQFWGVPPLNDLDPGVPGVVSAFDAEKAWPQAEAQEPPAGPYWVLAPGSNAESRRWPAERFVALAKFIAEETGWPGIIVGGPAEAPLAQALCEDRSARLKDWTARGSVASNWKLFRQARFTVSNDSGLAHVAALCGSPVQVVWGAGDPKRTEPIGPGRVRILFNPLACWPCERNTCALPAGQKLDCLKGIQAEAVWKEIKSGIRP